jgi:hypothetical protein
LLIVRGCGCGCVESGLLLLMIDGESGVLVDTGTVVEVEFSVFVWVDG